ncbi:MAG: ribosome silencing factor [Elusimicrobia bacterium RIFOXYB2_FULL_62_6]|nr:MAG: ribosome silencing factor [Elusimicrobia bacterium RIFOXYB2_FULL_62_6]
MTNTKLQFKKAAVAAARLADDKKGEDVAVYDLAGRSSLADYAMAVTVDSPAHLSAVDDEISVKLKQEGLYPLYRDGGQSRTWKVLDYGGLIVHIIERETRVRYSLDKLFDGLKKVPWEAPAPAAPKARKPAAGKADKKAPKAVKKAKPAKKKPGKAA